MVFKLVRAYQRHMLCALAALALGTGLAAGAVPAAGAVSAKAPGSHRPAGPHLMRPRPHGARAAVITGPLINHGGPVESAPIVYVDFWGWPSDPSGEQPYL